MEKYTWVPFYIELADKLLQYKNNRSELIKKVKQAHQIMELTLPRIETDNDYVPDIDPFTVFALFNRGKQKNETRQTICKGYKSVFNMTSSIPDDFNGIPMYFYNQYCFYRYVKDPKRDNNCFNYLWTLFEEAIIYSDNQSNISGFVDAFEKVMNLSLVGQSKMTIGLFHIRPNTFVSLDSNNNDLIIKELHEKVENLSGEEYLNICSSVLNFSKSELNGSIPEFSYYAYNNSDTVSEKWEPTLEEYDPHLTKEDWLNFMRESGKFTENHKFVLAALYDIGGEATCTQLEKHYGKPAIFFNSVSTSFAELVQDYTKCPKWTDKTGKERLYSIPYVGRNATDEEAGVYVWKLRPELKAAIEEYSLVGYLQTVSTTNENRKEGNIVVPKNIILYGPPGTGKTYNSAIYAVAIIEGKDVDEISLEPYSDIMERYNGYKENGQIEFTTFHQSYGYEEFIEGIRPVMDEDSEEAGAVEYQITPGLFKSFCERASHPVLKENNNIGINANPTIWKVSLEGTGDNPTRTECMENNHIRIGYDSYGEIITDETEFSAGGKSVLNSFISRMKIGDIVFSCYSATTIDAIGIVTGEYEWHDEYEHYKRLRNVKWLVKGINEDILEINAGKVMTLSSTYELINISISDAMSLINRTAHGSETVEDEQKNFVFIIDEINRGNISKIFGELITLIEPSKRKGQEEGMTARLPYSQKPFGVPDNVYIIGTMNTADRSIAALDTALRRRFCFKEMLPDSSKLNDVTVNDLNIGVMLSNMNKKISVLYDREHTIGHAYFMSLLKNQSIDNLARIFENNIIPLLQEYFYEDYEKIRLVLGDNKKDDERLQFIIVQNNEYYSLFGDSDVEFEDSITYEINNNAFRNIEAYKSI